MIEDPLPGYRFLVTLNPADAFLPAAQASRLRLVASGEFAEAGGLGAELEVTPQPEGGRNDFVHLLPVRHSWDRIVLRRGMVRDLGLWAWYRAGLFQSLGARRAGTVMLLTPSGRPAFAWAFTGGLAVRWAGPQLDALADAVAVETLEIAHEGLEQVPMSLPGTG